MIFLLSSLALSSFFLLVNLEKHNNDLVFSDFLIETNFYISETKIKVLDKLIRAEKSHNCAHLTNHNHKQLSIKETGSSSSRSSESIIEGKEEFVFTRFYNYSKELQNVSLIINITRIDKNDDRNKKFKSLIFGYNYNTVENTLEIYLTKDKTLDSEHIYLPLVINRTFTIGNCVKISFVSEETIEDENKNDFLDSEIKQEKFSKNILIVIGVSIIIIVINLIFLIIYIFTIIRRRRNKLKKDVKPMDYFQRKYKDYPIFDSIKLERARRAKTYLKKKQNRKKQQRRKKLDNLIFASTDTFQYCKTKSVKDQCCETPL